jgi:anti-sigma B factor antagonist
MTQFRNVGDLGREDAAERAGGEAMIRADEKTVLPLLHDEIGGRARYSEDSPALSLQMRCEVVHRLNAHPCWILRVAGSVDSRTSGELLEAIGLILGANQLSRLILDLDGVVRTDSSGVGALLAGLRDSQSQHVQFTLCGLRKALYDLLERTRLASLFEIRPTVEEALCR